MALISGSTHGDMKSQFALSGHLRSIGFDCLAELRCQLNSNGKLATFDSAGITVQIELGVLRCLI